MRTSVESTQKSSNHKFNIMIKKSPCKGLFLFDFNFKYLYISILIKPHMLKKYPFIMLWALYLCACACKKPIQTVVDSDVCLRNSSLFYQKKWAAIYSRVNYNDAM